MRALRLLLLVLLAASATALGARAEILVNVDKGDSKPVPIAITALGGAPEGARIAEVVSADLARSGLFEPLSLQGQRASSGDVNAEPDWSAWKPTGAQALLTGQTSLAEGRVTVAFRLWDVQAGDQLLGLQFSSTPYNWRRVAHRIADAIYEKVTGAPGYFDTRIAFVSIAGTKANPVRRLEIMDQDGADPSYLAEGDYLAFTPRFSATSRELTYMALRAAGSSIYLLNISTGRQEALGHFPGMVFAPRFSPDGGRVAFSVEKSGVTDIYVMDLATHATQRLTSGPAISTSPGFAPDGRRLVFNSDRGGSPQLYVMSVDGATSSRISFGVGRYTDPVWSPDGQWIAFVKQDGGGFHIGVMRPDGSGERLLTASYLDEGPAWAPNSRTLIFARTPKGGQSRLWTVDLSGREPRPAPYALPASDPAWSALLP
jgi:TolB protein